MKKKINNWSDYEKFRLFQDIEKFFGEFVVDLKSKIPDNPSTAELLAVGLFLAIFLFFIKSICSNLLLKKSNN